MKNLKSHLVFNKQQRGGILFLIGCIAVLLGVYHFVDFQEENVMDISSSEIVTLQTEIDSLRLAALESRIPKRYPFNPNFITDYKAYTLGMSLDEFDRLKKFRSKNNWINSKADFKNVTKVSDSLLNAIAPYFKFPDWVTNPTSRKKKRTNSFSEKPYAQKVDLNLASELQLQEVSGIGAALSKRIVAYREKIGGFSSDLQLQNVWGLEHAVVQRTLNLFTVKTPSKIIKMNLNTASASDIATIPGISFELAKKIWEFRRLRERIETFSQLEKIEGLSTHKLQLIQLYLSIE